MILNRWTLIKTLEITEKSWKKRMSYPYILYGYVLMDKNTPIHDKYKGHLSYEILEVLYELAFKASKYKEENGEYELLVDNNDLINADIEYSQNGISFFNTTLRTNVEGSLSGRIFINFAEAVVALSNTNQKSGSLYYFRYEHDDTGWEQPILRLIRPYEFLVRHLESGKISSGIY